MTPLPDSSRRNAESGEPDGLYINPDPLYDSGHLVTPEMRAGDLLFFMGSGQTHGAEAWRAEEDRCGVLMNVWGPNMIRGRRPVLPKL